MATVATTILWASASQADVIFSDDFNYANGQLAGKNGGTGWTGAWSGGNSQVANPLTGTVGKSINISNDGSVTSRQILGAPRTTGSSNYYISFLYNANPFQSGSNAGISISSSTNPYSNLYMGMPGGSNGQLGFDWTSHGDPSSPASNNTNYLILFGITPGTTLGTTSVNMYVTTNLLESWSSLEGSTPFVSLSNDANFTFDTVRIYGAYSSGTINLAGLAMATTANEAVAFTHAAVPEPGTLLLASIAATLGGCGIWRNRRKKPFPLPAA